MSSPKLNKFFYKTRLFLLYILPPCLFLSYHPIISLGADSTMNYELSLPLIWLVIYDLISLIDLFRFGLKKTFCGLSDAKFFAFSLFPLYASLSILWSANPTRAVLTAGVIWALFIAIFTTYQFFRSLRPSEFELAKTKILDVLYFSTTVVCIFCWLQCGLDLLGLNRDATLMCAGCTYQSFGFPHPNGFAIEPQFMGNLLLAPCLIKLYSLLKTRNLRFTSILFEIFYVATLFLTFSRGAIYSFIIAALILISYFIIKKKSAAPLLASLLIILPFCFTLVAEGAMAELSPTSDTFATGISKSIHHLSLGKIDFRSGSAAESTSESTEQNSEQNSAQSSELTTTSTKPASNYDGYVAASTEIRLNLSEYAISTWSSSPRNIFFGVGLGGAGVALSNAHPEAFSAKEIIQNEYISLLLETGLIGIITLIPGLFIILKRKKLIIFYALLAAYAVSLCFFSGLPNALHIYLVLGFLSVL